MKARVTAAFVASYEDQVLVLSVDDLLEDPIASYCVANGLPVVEIADEATRAPSVEAVPAPEAAPVETPPQAEQPAPEAPVVEQPPVAADAPAVVTDAAPEQPQATSGI